VNRKQNSACLDVSFVSLSFVLRDSHPNKRANNTADGTPDS